MVGARGEQASQQIRPLSADAIDRVAYDGWQRARLRESQASQAFSSSAVPSPIERVPSLHTLNEAQAKHDRFLMQARSSRIIQQLGIDIDNLARPVEDRRSQLNISQIPMLSSRKLFIKRNADES